MTSMKTLINIWKKVTFSIILDPKVQGKDVRRRNNQDEIKADKGKSKQNSLITDDQVGLDFEIERKMLHEKKELLNEV